MALGQAEWRRLPGKTESFKVLSQGEGPGPPRALPPSEGMKGRCLYLCPSRGAAVTAAVARSDAQPPPTSIRPPPQQAQLPPRCHPLLRGAGWRSPVLAEPGRPRPAPPPSALLGRQEREAAAEPGAGRRGEEGPPVGSEE